MILKFQVDIQGSRMEFYSWRTPKYHKYHKYHSPTVSVKGSMFLIMSLRVQYSITLSWLIHPAWVYTIGHKTWNNSYLEDNYFYQLFVSITRGWNIRQLFYKFPKTLIQTTGKLRKVDTQWTSENGPLLIDCPFFRFSSHRLCFNIGKCSFIL